MYYNLYLKTVEEERGRNMEKITSKNNELIKYAKKLFTSHRARISEQKFVLEGARLCFDALNSDTAVTHFLITEKAAEKYPAQLEKMVKISDSAYFISEEAAEKLGGTQSTQGVFCICEMQKKTAEIEKDKKYIALDRIQDPSNLGALIRTAEALGIDGAICFSCCDAYNPKALRASMGSILRLPVIPSLDLAADIDNARAVGFSAYAAVPSGNARDVTAVNFPASSICVIGNEANGVSDEVKNAADELITINMPGRAESLNASTAGAIVMWEMVRGK